MSELHPNATESCCESPLTFAGGGNALPELSLPEALDRFAREAVRGTCDTGRYRCPYYTWGSGPPLLFIPGLGCDALSFAPVIARLADRFRCIAYDFPQGQGDGAQLDAYTHADLTADVLTLLDHVHEKQGYLLGFSFGSTIALAALRDRPERWARGVLLSGFAQRRLAPAEVLVARLGRHWQAPVRVLPLLEPMLRLGHFSPLADQPDMWRFFLERSGAPPLAALAHRALLLHQCDLTATLAEVRQPVLLITGDLDPLVNDACTATLNRGLSSVAHVELTNCGHFALFSHAAALANLVRHFLTPACATACPTAQ